MRVSPWPFIRRSVILAAHGPMRRPSASNAGIQGFTLQVFSVPRSPIRGWEWQGGLISLFRPLGKWQGSIGLWRIICQSVELWIPAFGIVRLLGGSGGARMTEQAMMGHWFAKEVMIHHTTWVKQDDPNKWGNYRSRHISYPFSIRFCLSRSIPFSKII